MALDRPVGQRLSNLRRPGPLDDHPKWKAALETVDEHWNPERPADWQRHYAALRELVRDKGRADVLPGVTVHGMDVGGSLRSSANVQSGTGGWTDSANSWRTSASSRRPRNRKHP
ncbi:hypothetical protein [Streptomyces longisporus]|uniref:Uncharacterized protein n=1 Tax=Streptomyces longisporus TaxID=1948 RepID=A0ABP5YWM2_STRLO